MEVTRGCSIGSMPLVDNSSNAGAEARVINGSSISGSMEAQDSSSSISSSISGSMEAEGSNSLSLSLSSSSSSSSSTGGHMLLRSGALVRLATPIACGIRLSPQRLQERQSTDTTFARGVTPESIGA